MRISDGRKEPGTGVVMSETKTPSVTEEERISV